MLSCRSASQDVYIFLGDDLLLVEVDVEEDLLGGDVAVIGEVGVEGEEDGLALPGLLGEDVLFGRGVSSVEGDDVLALGTVLVALDVADEDEFCVLGLVDCRPLPVQN